jgi:hypothetical protein
MQVNNVSTVSPSIASALDPPGKGRNSLEQLSSIHNGANAIPVEPVESHSARQGTRSGCFSWISRVLVGVRNMCGPGQASPPEPPATNVLIGYHGTNASGAKDLVANGVREDYETSSAKLVNYKYGEGFYITTDPNIAADYARSHLQNGGKANVLKVYAKVMDRGTKGTKFDLGQKGDEDVVIFRHEGYKDLELKRHKTVVFDHDTKSVVIRKDSLIDVGASPDGST